MTTVEILCVVFLIMVGFAVIGITAVVLLMWAFIAAADTINNMKQ